MEQITQVEQPAPDDKKIVEAILLLVGTLKEGGLDQTLIQSALDAYRTRVQSQPGSRLPF